jgi:hypothetical protein
MRYSARTEDSRWTSLPFETRGVGSTRSGGTEEAVWVMSTGWVPTPSHADKHTLCGRGGTGSRGCFEVRDGKGVVGGPESAVRVGDAGWEAGDDVAFLVWQ